MHDEPPRRRHRHNDLHRIRNPSVAWFEDARLGFAKNADAFSMSVRDHHHGRAVVSGSEHGVLDVSENRPRRETIEDLVIETHPHRRATRSQRFAQPRPAGFPRPRPYRCRGPAGSSSSTIPTTGQSSPSTAVAHFDGLPPSAPRHQASSQLQPECRRRAACHNPKMFALTP